jgi:hypothetical protein
MLAGTLTINRINSFIPAINESFQIITAAVVTGTFSSVQGTFIASGRSFQTSYSATGVTLTAP